MTRLVCLVASALGAGAVCAAPFADPTQPPVIHDQMAAGRYGGTRVESILIAPDRRLAVISGQQVAVGGQVGAGTVVRITETEVVVRGADGEQTLKLFPDVAVGALSGKGRSK
ncbi:hypothetical protein AYO46_06830 [Betaproteobacteria bacterium SCGC AG-212-J23]|nr:hypothetical protein AYO46_06830 [Betaproteobacteria bacterium SCGC AG-212-J23]